MNATTLIGLGMVLWTLPLVERDIRRHQRALKLLRAGKCRSCGYDVRGLGEGTNVCPECGKALRDRDDPPAG